MGEALSCRRCAVAGETDVARHVATGVVAGRTAQRAGDVLAVVQLRDAAIPRDLAGEPVKAVVLRDGPHRSPERCAIGECLQLPAQRPARHVVETARRRSIRAIDAICCILKTATQPRRASARLRACLTAGAGLRRKATRRAAPPEPVEGFGARDVAALDRGMATLVARLLPVIRKGLRRRPAPAVKQALTR